MTEIWFGITRQKAAGDGASHERGAGSAGSPYARKTQANQGLSEPEMAEQRNISLRRARSEVLQL